MATVLQRGNYRALLMWGDTPESAVGLQQIRQLIDIVGELAGVDGVGRRTHSGHADLCGYRADRARVVTGDHFQRDSLFGEESQCLLRIISDSFSEHDQRHRDKRSR